VNKIRVLLAHHPMMIPDAIRQFLAEQEDMEVVGEVRGPMKILQETGRVNADAVILAQEGTEEPALCSQLLAVYPDLTIVSVTTDLTTAITQQLRSHRQCVLGRDVVDVVRAMRVAVRQPYSEKWA
jgi:DNA-binding NarL/FixJ family response regulator